LVQKKEMRIFDLMRKDDQVKAAGLVKKYSRLSADWHIQPASTSPEDLTIARFYEDMLAQLPGTVIQVLLNQMTCLDYGFSIMEKNYAYIEDGEWAGKIGLSSIKSKKPHDFDFRMDEYSNVIAYVQNQAGDEEELPPDKFIRTTWMPEWENPYGTSDLKAAYRPFWVKDVLMKFWPMHLERYASPPSVGTYPPGTSEKDKTDFLEVLEDLVIKSAIIKREGLEIDFPEVSGSGAKMYENALDRLDMMIARSMLIPELLGLASRQVTGSFALGKKQFDLFIGIINHLGKVLEEVWHEQLTIPYIDFNYHVTQYPRLEFGVITEESDEMKAKIAGTLITAGLLDPTDPETQRLLSDYITLLPPPNSESGARMAEALDFSIPYRFVDPTGRDVFEVDLVENMARVEVLEDSYQTG
jgi:phage gp29-like protein